MTAVAAPNSPIPFSPSLHETNFRPDFLHKRTISKANLSSTPSSPRLHSPTLSPFPTRHRPKSHSPARTLRFRPEAEEISPQPSDGWEHPPHHPQPAGGEPQDDDEVAHADRPTPASHVRIRSRGMEEEVEGSSDSAGSPREETSLRGRSKFRGRGKGSSLVRSARPGLWRTRDYHCRGPARGNGVGVGDDEEVSTSTVMGGLGE